MSNIKMYNNTKQLKNLLAPPNRNLANLLIYVTCDVRYRKY